MENMSRVLLDAERDEWSVVVTHGDREDTCAQFPEGIQFVRLHPHKTDDGITLTLDGETIGHLPADLAYFYRPVSRVIGAGMTMYAECRVEEFDGKRYLVIPYIHRRDLERWASGKISNYRRHLAAKRRIGDAPLHRTNRSLAAVS
jgi:hypothetical protein